MDMDSSQTFIENSFISRSDVNSMDVLNFTAISALVNPV